MVKVGVVLGRFQPFHKGHLNYVLLALRASRTLIIGITTPGKKPTQYEPQDPQRFGKRNNPFNFLERKKMIKDALTEEGIALKKVKFIHFRPERLDLWLKKVPRNVTYFLILRTKDKSQAAEMRSQGLKVRILKVIKEDEYKGLNVRKLLKADSKWINLVPESTANFLKEKSVKKNLK